MSKLVEVVATAKGYYGAIREPGDKFEVPQGTTGSWFELVEAEGKPKATRKSAKPAAQAAESEDPDAEDLV